MLESLPRRRYPAGATVVAEGESPRELCVTHAGSADVYVSGRHGAEHVVGRAGPGTTIGEMSLFTGRPAVGTVRAVDELEVIVLGESDFERICAAFPQVYRNLGAILSERLAHTDRLVARDQPGRLIALQDHGASLLGPYALGCSIAWHTRASTLVLAVGSGEAEPIAAAAGDLAAPPPDARAVLAVVPPEGRFAPDAIAGTLAELCNRWACVLVAVEPPLAVTEGVRVVRLGAPPALAAADEEALRTGLLSSSTAAGKALGRVARDVAGLKVGVALGAGSIRGFAHWGVLDALEELNIPVDCIAGSSVGGSVAAMYAAGIRGAEGVAVFERAASTLFRPTLPRRGLLSSRALARFLERVHGDSRIEDLDLPLAIVTTDIRSRRSIVLRRGPVHKAVLATLAIPGIFPAQRSGSYILVDGGVLDPVPIAVTADLGADVVIGVRLLSRPTPDDVDAEVQEDSSAPRPSALATIMRSIEIMQTRLGPEPVNATSIVIAPELENIPSMKLRNFAAGLRYVESGAVETRNALPRLAAALPWLRSAPS